MSTPFGPVNTATCPRCYQKVNSQAITCPYCRTELKAYGHPGVTLHRAPLGSYLCDSCTYHADDTCNFPQRPHAQECTLYQNLVERNLELQQLRRSPSLSAKWKNWLRQNQALVLLLALFLVCLLVSLLNFGS